MTLFNFQFGFTLLNQHSTVIVKTERAKSFYSVNRICSVFIRTKRTQQQTTIEFEFNEC